jgi:hypothetical protein
MTEQQATQQAVTVKQPAAPAGAEVIEAVIAKGDLAQLTPAERVNYYQAVCKSLGLNALTKPFDYIELNGRLTLYATRGATDQLRKLYNISLRVVNREIVDDIYIVTVEASTPDGRVDTEIGAVSLVKEDGEWKTAPNGKRYFERNGKWVPLRGEERANSLMRCITKGKRRATLSIVGLGWLDEIEIETVPTARHVSIDVSTGELQQLAPPAAVAGQTEHESGSVLETAQAVSEDDEPDYLSDAEHQKNVRQYLLVRCGWTQARADDAIAHWTADGLSRRQIVAAIEQARKEH